MGLCPFFFIKFKMLNNRIDSTEIIKIADAVADEKSIDKNIVLNSMESAIEKRPGPDMVPIMKFMLK